MLGAIAGDIIGSVHEFRGRKTKDFPLFVDDSRFTDDTVLTVAVADTLLTGVSYVDNFHEFTIRYPDRCYGARFWHWVNSGAREPYNSWSSTNRAPSSPPHGKPVTAPVGVPLTRLGIELLHARRGRNRVEARDGAWRPRRPKRRAAESARRRVPPRTRFPREAGCRARSSSCS